MTELEKMAANFVFEHTGLSEVSVELEVLKRVVNAAFQDGFIKGREMACECISGQMVPSWVKKNIEQLGESEAK